MSKSFRDLDTETLAKMVYCAIDSPSSVLAERVKGLLEQLERHERALQYAVDHAESLGYSYSAMWLRELQEVTRGERSWEDAGVVASV